MFGGVNRIKKSTHVGKIKDKRGEKSMNAEEEGRLKKKKK